MIRVLRPLLLVATVLAFIILGSSATLRLAANGIGCSPWPSCYGLSETATQVQDTYLIKFLRIAHRLTASTFALLSLALVAMAWRHWSNRTRVLGIAMIAVTAMLAWVGMHTPSPMPLITVINVIGGLTLLALCAALWQLTEADSDTVHPGFAHKALGVIAVLLIVQAALGSMISARLAATDCTGGCAHLNDWFGSLGVFNPLIPGRSDQFSNHQAAGQWLHMLHRLLGVALLIMAATLVYVQSRAQRRRISGLVYAMVTTLTFGVAAVQFDEYLVLAVGHALCAGLTATALGMALARTRGARR